MAYWWVSHRKTYESELDGEYLWAPKKDRGGRTPFHWKTMLEVQPGDFVFSYVRKQIVAISTVSSTAIDAPRPEGFSEDWQKDGWLVRLASQRLERKLKVQEVLGELLPLMEKHGAPLTRNGSGNQGYLYRLAPRAGRFLLAQLGLSNHVLDEIASRPFRDTERSQTGKARVGQKEFREALLDYWGGRCSCTGVSVESLLRASHIKPWRDSNHEERMDPFNGLLLCVNYDAAFDAGLISFHEDGGVLLSRDFSPNEAAKCGILSQMGIQSLSSAHQVYLEHHRVEVFRG